jgi:hypothetical protein
MPQQHTITHLVWDVPFSRAALAMRRLRSIAIGLERLPSLSAMPTPPPKAGTMRTTGALPNKGLAVLLELGGPGIPLNCGDEEKREVWDTAPAGSSTFG